MHEKRFGFYFLEAVSSFKQWLLLIFKPVKIVNTFLLKEKGETEITQNTLKLNKKSSI